MYTNFVILSAFVSSVLASPQSASPSGVALGQQCDPTVANVCAGGASCYATNSMLIPVCGNFQASCTTDSQCAFNTCNRGLCNGFVATTSSTQTAPPKPTGTNLPLGVACDPALAGACANGVNCYASNYMLQPLCGNTQSTCTRDDQCAFQNCFGGVCSGPPVSSKTAAFATSTSTSTSTSTLTSTSTSGPAKPTGTNLGLGENCDPSLPNACANSVNCYATNYMLQPRCGNFQASCRSNADCAFNTCNGGLCNGFLSTSSFPSATPRPTGGFTIGTSTGNPAPSPTATPPLQANGAGHIEAGVVGLFGLLFAALLL